jgi:hypothetical protein
MKVYKTIDILINPSKRYQTIGILINNNKLYHTVTSYIDVLPSIISIRSYGFDDVRLYD